MSAWPVWAAGNLDVRVELPQVKGFGLYLRGSMAPSTKAEDGAGVFARAARQARAPKSPAAALFLAVALRADQRGVHGQRRDRCATDLGGCMPSGFTGVGHVIGVASNVDIVHVLALQIVEELQGSSHRGLGGCWVGELGCGWVVVVGVGCECCGRCMAV